MSRTELHSTAELLQVAQMIACTEAEGPGKRFALWFQGCPLRCPGCCNPEMLPFIGGQEIPVGETIQQIHEAKQNHEIEGITLIGGEPFAHAIGAAVLAGEAQALGLSVMIFSGFTLEELRTRPEPEIAELLARTDLLVDGPYLKEEPDVLRRWIGSRNQRIHFLSDRYQPEDERWRSRDTLEIRLVNGELSINGFPAQQAVGLWKRISPVKMPKKE